MGSSAVRMGRRYDIVIQDEWTGEKCIIIGNSNGSLEVNGYELRKQIFFFTHVQHIGAGPE